MPKAGSSSPQLSGILPVNVSYSVSGPALGSNGNPEISLVVHWLRLHASTAGRGTKFPSQVRELSSHMLRGSQKIKIVIIFKHKEINNGDAVVVEPAQPCPSQSSQSSGEIDSPPDSDKPEWSGMGWEKPKGCEHPVVKDGPGPCCFRVSILARINFTNT